MVLLATVHSDMRVFCYSGIVCLPHWAEYLSNSKARKPRGTTGGQRDDGVRDSPQFKFEEGD